MKKLSARFSALGATLLLSAGIGLTSVVVQPGAEANAASCTASVALRNGGWSKAITCSRSQYSEKVSGKWVYAPARLKGQTSSFNVCYVGYQASAAKIWY